MRVLVTGANGFVGQALCRRLWHEKIHEVVVAVRGEAKSSLGIAHYPVGDIHSQTTWKHALEGVDVVVHLAARVHVKCDESNDPPTEFRKVNTEGTLNLARQAAQAGVRRFVFLSSVKVNGEGAACPDPKIPPALALPREEGGNVSLGVRGCFREDDAPAPQGAYAISKWEAEQGLIAIARETEMEVLILRPPLVYGPGVGANFLRLLRLVERGALLPFGTVDNQRSLLYLGNLVHAIALCLTHPAAANQTYLVSDGEDVSTPDLIRRLAAQMGKRARLLPVPVRWLELAGGIVGKGAEVRRLLGSLAVDSGKIRHELGWRPPYTLEEGVAETVRWLRRR